MKGLKGQISVFLAMIFLLVAALIMATLESARASALDYLTGMAARSGIESVFAAFDSDLLQDFGLLGVRGRAMQGRIWSLTAARDGETASDWPLCPPRQTTRSI